MLAEIYGAPSSPCCKCTGNVVRSASSPVSTTSCTGACAEGTSIGATGCRRRSRRAAGKPGSSVSSAAARPHHVADKLRLFRPDCAEPDRAGITIQHRGYVDEVDWTVVDDAFALLHQLLDEMAQAKFFSIGHEDAFQSIACSLSGNLSGVIPRGPERRAVTTNAIRQSSAAYFRGDHRDCRCGPSGRSGPAL